MAEKEVLFKPMLSGECTDINKLRYPVLVSPKLDGIRAVVLNGVLVSRNLKPIRNKQLQARYSKPEYEGLDGELIVGDPRGKDCFRNTTSIVSSFDKDASAVIFWVFDVVPQVGIGHQFQVRRLRIEPHLSKDIKSVPHKIISSAEELTAWEEAWLEEGFEGLMIRDPLGPYKQGRSTELEGWLLKLKRFEDAEAEVIGVEEQMQNANELTRDDLGYAKRSTHKANLIGKDVLGAFKMRGLNGPYKGVEFNVGTGLTDAERVKLWFIKDSLLGRIVKYRYFPSGSKDAPRFPTFLGFRDAGDMS